MKIVFINARLWCYHLQIWNWGARIIRAESGSNRFGVDDFMRTY